MILLTTAVFICIMEILIQIVIPLKLNYYNQIK